ncbi:MAG: HipA family kinase [Dissulfurispiraceae bacterium]
MTLLNTLEAVDYIARMPNSTTTALLVLCNNDKQYVLKHGNSIEEGGGIKMLVAEYICYRIAKYFRLPIPEYCFIIVGPRFRNSIRDQKVKGLLEKSADLCIGSEFIVWTETFRKYHKRRVNNKLMLAAIFGFDQYVYNSDRFIENPNLLFDRFKKEILMIDHSSAIWPIFDRVEKLDDAVKGSEHHILCFNDMADKAAIVPLVKDMPNEIIDRYVDSVPEEWFRGIKNKDKDDEFTREFLRKLLKKRRDSIEKIISEVPVCSEINILTRSIT